MLRRVLVALALPGLLAVAACGGGADEGLEVPASVTAMLELVPATEAQQQMVTFGSLAHVRARGGYEPADDVRREVDQLQDVAPSGWVVASPFREQVFAGDFRREVGFDLTDIDASMTVGSPPELLSVFTGRIDATRIDRALTTFAPFADDLDRGERHRVATYRFGEEGEVNLEQRTPARPLGENLRFGVDDGRLWWTRSDAQLDAAVEATAGDGSSLADVDGFAPVADALDDAGVFTAVLTGDPESWRFDPALVAGDRLTPEQLADLEERFTDAGLERWEVAALADTFPDAEADDGDAADETATEPGTDETAADGGNDTSDDGDRDPGAGDSGAGESEPGPALDFVIVLWHADEAAAERNRDALERVLTDGRSAVNDVAWSHRCADPIVRQDGQLVVARCRSAQAHQALDIFLLRDTLLSWL